MKNKEYKQNIPEALDDDALDNVSGGLIEIIVTDCQVSASGDSSDTGTNIMSGSMLR